jgi:hypothetical protein
MKFCKVSIFLALLAAVCLPAVAQSQLQAKIPFNFSVAGKSLPAGHYRVTQVVAGEQNVWLVSGHKDGVMMLTNPVESRQKAHPLSLVFWHTGTTYSLVQIWPKGHSGRALLLRSTVKTTVLAEGARSVENGTYVEIAGE